MSRKTIAAIAAGAVTAFASTSASAVTFDLEGLVSVTTPVPDGQFAVPQGSVQVNHGGALIVENGNTYLRGISFYFNQYDDEVCCMRWLEGFEARAARAEDVGKTVYAGFNLLNPIVLTREWTTYIFSTPIVDRGGVYVGTLDFKSTPMFDIDDVIMIAQPGVPEPSTWALMILGFGLIGAALRQRDASASAEVAYFAQEDW